MIRIVLKRTPKPPDDPRDGITHWEWALEATRRSLGLVCSAVFADGERRFADCYEANVTGHWAWGGGHFWYDGPHCFFSVGPVHFAWRNWSCKRCHSDGHDDEREE